MTCWLQMEHLSDFSCVWAEGQMCSPFGGAVDALATDGIVGFGASRLRFIKWFGRNLCASCCQQTSRHQQPSFLCATDVQCCTKTIKTILVGHISCTGNMILHYDEQKQPLHFTKYHNVILHSYLKHFWFLSCLCEMHYMITVRGIMTLLSNEVVLSTCVRWEHFTQVLSLHSRWFCVMNLDLSGVH